MQNIVSLKKHVVVEISTMRCKSKNQFGVQNLCSIIFKK